MGTLAGIEACKSSAILDGFGPYHLLIVVEYQQSTAILFHKFGEVGMFLLELAVGIGNGNAVKEVIVALGGIVGEFCVGSTFLGAADEVDHIEQAVFLAGDPCQHGVLYKDRIGGRPFAGEDPVVKVRYQPVDVGLHHHRLVLLFLLALLGHRGGGQVYHAVFLLGHGGEGFAGGVATRVADHALAIIGLQFIERGALLALDEFHQVPSILGVERT